MRSSRVVVLFAVAAMVAASTATMAVSAFAASSDADESIVVPLVRVGNPPAPAPPIRQSQLATARNSDVVLIVTARSSSQLASIAAGVNRQNWTLRHTSSALRMVSLQVPAARATVATALLRALPGVTNVEVAETRHIDGGPNDPDFALDQSSYLTAVNAPAAWTVQHGSPNVKIAVVDTGVDVNHPDLKAKIVGTYNVVTGKTDVTDALGHGTFVAGVAAAATNNGVGVAGAGYDTSLLAVKVADSSGIITVDSEALGIIWAADHGANVINLSLGGSTSSAAEQSAITYAQGRGVLIVAAAGNDASTAHEYPASYPGVIAVGATNGSSRASFSNYGSWVTLAAPGVNIFSTTPTAGSTLFAAKYAHGDGTSFSTPLVAGEAALIKADDPTATTSTLRTALVHSAHGFAGLGLGAGRVDFSAALRHITPSTTPAAVNVTGTAGTVVFSVTSTAPAVEFQVDSGAFTAPIATISGVATYNWPSWGFGNGAHSVQAVDCSQSGECASAHGSATLVLDNAAPAITSPGTGALVSGAFTIAASSPGSVVQFLIDGIPAGFDATSPYSLAYTGSRLANAPHTVTVVECSADRSRCDGPKSPTVSFQSDSLHPTLTSVLPSPFSPNGDRAKDTTKIVLNLPDTEVVVVRVRNGSGVVVRGPGTLGRLVGGAHAWTWNGRTNGNVVVANGTYTVELDTSLPGSGQPKLGSATTTVRVDKSAPTLALTSGANVTFFPYPDGYRDTFSPAVTVNEPSTLSLVVRNSRRIIRTISVHKGAGRTSITWNGRDSASRIVPAGTYTWYFTAVDSASNARRGPAHVVHVSARRLIRKTTVLTRNGSSYSNVVADIPGCSTASTASSRFFPYGVRISTTCDPYLNGYNVVAANYRFALPAAVNYGTMRMLVYGTTSEVPSEIMAGFYRPAAGYFDVPGNVKVGSRTNAWYSLGSVPAAGHYSSTHVATIAIGVDNYYYPPSNFDIRYVRLTISYNVLR